MIYQKFSPREILSPFVECYFVWESSSEVIKGLVVESPPSGFCSIVFNCGDDYSIQNKKYEKLVVPKQFISGQSIYSYKLFLNGRISIAGIVFKPAALATLFDLPTYAYTEERIPLSRVFSSALINSFIEKIQSVPEANEKVKLLQEFVLIFYHQNKPKPDYIDYAANLIVEKNGMVHVSDLLKEVFMSRRNFERKFFRKVGLSPKYYARIRRMSYLMNEIAGKKKVDWASLFSQCEFYDQSHFIKDFIEFTGRTPEQYIKENAELANIIEKPKTQNIG
jgi:AraC-like DNA-binding protein